jgi:hypothetical protein
MAVQLGAAEVCWEPIPGMKLECEPLFVYILLNYKSAPGFQFACDDKGKVYHVRIRKEAKIGNRH